MEFYFVRYIIIQVGTYISEDFVRTHNNNILVSCQNALSLYYLFTFSV